MREIYELDYIKEPLPDDEPKGRVIDTEGGDEFSKFLIFGFVGFVIALVIGTIGHFIWGWHVDATWLAGGFALFGGVYVTYKIFRK